MLITKPQHSGSETRHVLVDMERRPWIRDMVRFYGPWTSTANGAGLEAQYEIDHPPSEWNDVYFNIMAYCLPGLDLPEIEKFELALINSLADKPFFDAVTEFLRNVDIVYFNKNGLQKSDAVGIRSALSNRMMTSRGWRWFAESRSTSIEIHIGPAIAVFFFNDRDFVQPAKCYLFPEAIDRLDPFIPVLEILVKRSPYIFIAILTLNMLEVSPRPTHLPFIVEAAKTWLKNNPADRGFWVDHDIGRRLCTWIEEVRRQAPALFGSDNAVRFDVDRLLAALVNLGVAEARRIEEALASGSGSRQSDPAEG